MPRAQVYADILRRLLRSGAKQRAEKVLGKLRSADAADVLDRVAPAERRPMLDLLFAAGRAGSVMKELPEERLGEVLALVDDERLTGLVAKLATDDAAWFVERLPEERRERLLGALDPRARGDIERILRYPAGTAGSVMNTRVFALPASATAQEAIDRLRARDAEEADSIYYLYVVDTDGRLGGVVAVRRLVAARPDRPVGELAMADPLAVLASSTAEEAARLVARYNLLAVPVVDEDRRLLGIITVDDIIDVIQEQATQALYGLAGLSEDDRIFSPILTSFRKRLPWMVLNLFTAFLAAWVVGLFSASIAQVVALATFMPIVAGMGGNCGMQALTVVTRGVALGEMELISGLRTIAKELAVSLGIGACTGLVTAAVASLWTGQPMIGLVLFLAMVINLSIAGFSGAAIPLFLRAIKRDPALGGTVMLTTFTDCIGYGAFLGIATLLLRYLT
ncbi:MAG: magnesium transporter [Myxococcales bacterium]|nr:magnesium transporter [Myxococcales bacterium]